MFNYMYSVVLLASLLVTCACMLLDGWHEFGMWLQCCMLPCSDTESCIACCTAVCGEQTHAVINLMTCMYVVKVGLVCSGLRMLSI